MTRAFFFSALLVALSAVLPSSAGAVESISAHTVARDVPYVIGYHPLHSMQHPYLGQLHLNFNNGIISGRYTDISVRPGGPLANARNVAVSGGLGGDGHVSLIIRQITFRGSMRGAVMSGSATIRGQIYAFEAHQGTPGSGKP